LTINLKHDILAKGLNKVRNAVRDVVGDAVGDAAVLDVNYHYVLVGKRRINGANTQTERRLGQFERAEERLIVGSGRHKAVRHVRTQEGAGRAIIARRPSL
jgi:hypothetical protein